MFNRAPVSDDVQIWLVQQFDWAITTGLLRKDSPLVTPEQKYFPAPKGDAEKVVQGLIGNILTLLGHGDDRIEVLPLDRPSAEYRAAGAFQNTSEVAGAWSGEPDASVIFYDPEMIARPGVLLATLVHEVMHHVLHKYPTAEGPDEELRTDVHMITTGFGLIAMIGAEESGWHGYMRQPTRAHGLAMFLALFGKDHRETEKWLSGRMTKAVRRSTKILVTSGVMAPLKDRLAA